MDTVIFTILIYIGIIAAAVSGTLTGIKKRLDLFGIVSLAVATALGGGIIRDVLIGQFPPVAFSSPYWFLASVAAAITTILFYKNTNQAEKHNYCLGRDWPRGFHWAWCGCRSFHSRCRDVPRPFDGACHRNRRRHCSRYFYKRNSFRVQEGGLCGSLHSRGVHLLHTGRSCSGFSYFL
jgi:Glycine transporter